MSEPRRVAALSAIGSLGLIAVVISGAAAAFAFTAGFLSPRRLSPDAFLAALKPPTGVSLGHRRNHAKGICFTGVFEANGEGALLSQAHMFIRGRYPALGRLNLATADANAVDGMARVRGMGLRVSTPDGQEWRSAMITAPVFPAATPQAFYALLIASASKDPQAIPAYAAAHRQIAGFGAWAKTAPWTDSYAEDPFNSLNSFLFTDGTGAVHAVRWSLRPSVAAVAVAPAELAKRGPDFLEQDITERVRGGPVRWSMVVTLANPGDPTADPTQAWPADRRTVTVGTLIVQQIEAEPNGPCRDINFDPTVLPPGISTSDDPFPAARAAVYARSYDLRTSEEDDYPRSGTAAKP